MCVCVCEYESAFFQWVSLLILLPYTKNGDTCILNSLKIPNFIPNKHQLRKVILYYFISMKSATEKYRLLVEIYGEHTPSKFTLKNGLDDFKMKIFCLEIKEYIKP